MYHFTVSYTSNGGPRSAVWNFEYVFRINSGWKAGDVVRDAFSFNMPAWVGSAKPEDAIAFWHAAEVWGSSELRVGYKIEFALPRELSKVDQSILARLMVNKIVEISVSNEKPGSTVPISFAIHEGIKVGRDDPNPHLHALLSNTISDRHTRGARSWFRRWNASEPAKGGAKKSRFIGSKKWLHKIREAWSQVGNAFLLSRDFAPRLDHRSHAARGKRKLPQVHLGNSAINQAKKGVITLEYLRNLRVREHNETIDVQRLLRIRQRLRERAWRHEEEERALQLQAEDLLDEHELGCANIARVLDVMTLTVHSGVDNSAVLHSEFRDPMLLEKVVSAAGPQLAVFRTRTGIWMLSPDSDSVAVVTELMVTTDSRDMDMLSAVRRVAAILSFERPIVRVRSALASLAAELFKADQYRLKEKSEALPAGPKK